MLLLLLACAEPSKSEPIDPVGEDPADDTGGGDDTGEEPLWDIDREPGCNPLATADDCFLPYPSLHYTAEDATSATGRRLAYTQGMFVAADGGDLPVDFAIFNHADGVSPLSAALVNFGVDIDPAQLAGWTEAEMTLADDYPIALVHAETGERVPLLTEMDQNNRDGLFEGDYDGRAALIIRPLVPLESGARYVAVLHQDLRAADGSALEPPDAFVALRDGILTSDADVEAMRDRYEGVFEAAETAGYAREELLLAWDFQVASEDHVLGVARSMRQQALADIAANGVSYTIESVAVAPNANVGLMVKGTFYPPNFLTPDNDLARDGAYGVTMQESRVGYPFTMLVPPAAETRSDLPLVVFGHGLFGSGEGYLDGWVGEALVQPLSAQGDAVVIATDWIGLSDGDLDLILTEVVPDLTRVTIITDRLAQSLVNALSLTELALGELQEDPQLGGESFLSGEVYYYGVSLGGIQGASFTSLSPRVSRAALAVPGSTWSVMIQRSRDFIPIEELVDALHPDPLAQLVFLRALQGYFDHSDPGNLGALMFEEDPDYPTTPAVLLQEAVGDCQVPNLATDILARRIGASHLEIATDPIYGLPTVAGPTADPVVTQYRLPEALAEFFPADQNTIPEADNSVHSDAAMSEPALNQVLQLFATGMTSHVCDGACDPD